jgi:UDP-glucose 4-epimerase
MSHTLTWVVGRGGLLGSHLVPALEAAIEGAVSWDNPAGKFSWNDPSALTEQIENAVAGFARAVGSGNRRWMVLWAAGAGVVGSSTATLAGEALAWEALLESLSRHRALLGEAGLVFYASSAGGVYGRTSGTALTEASPCHPVSDYGRHKLKQEQRFREWALRHPGVASVIGRISNIYGPGQNLSKPQGIISHLSRCLIYQHPAHIYVPLDTIRDYIYVDDCARQIVECCRQVFLSNCRCQLLKLIASEQPTSLARIVGIFTRLDRRHPLLVPAPGAGKGLQPRSLPFRSTVAPNLTCLPRTRLEIGIDRVHRHQRVLFSQGRLPPPARAVYRLAIEQTEAK